MCRDGEAKGPASLVPGSSSCSPGQTSDVQQSVPWHTEDEAGAVLGEVRLRLIKPRLHRDGAFLPMQAALHWIGDIHLKVALLTVRREKIGQAGSEWADRELCGFLGNPQGPAICQDPVGWQFQGSTCFLPRGPQRREGDRGTEVCAAAGRCWQGRRAAHPGNPVCCRTREADVAVPLPGLG